MIDANDYDMADPDERRAYAIDQLTWSARHGREAVDELAAQVHDAPGLRKIVLGFLHALDPSVELLREWLRGFDQADEIDAEVWNEPTMAVVRRLQEVETRRDWCKRALDGLWN